MAKDEYRGLSFFVRLPGVDKTARSPMRTMLGLAMVLHKQFNAELFDGARSLYAQTIEHDRQQITDYERSQRLAKNEKCALLREAMNQHDLFAEEPKALLLFLMQRKSKSYTACVRKFCSTIIVIMCWMNPASPTVNTTV